MGLIFLIFPVAEIYTWYLFIERYSFGDALMLTFTTGLLGFFLAGLHGKSVLMNLQTSLVAGQVPSARILNQGSIILGGVFLMVPGLICKFIGAGLILPGTRHLFVLWFKFFVLGKIAKGSFRVFGPVDLGGFGRPSGAGNTAQDLRDVVEIKPKSIEHQDKT